MADDIFRLRPGKLTLGELNWLMKKPRAIEVEPAAWPAVEASSEVVRAIVAEGRHRLWRQYGIRQPGQDAHPGERSGRLQRRLVLSHAAGTGSLLEDYLVRGIMIAKINGLSRGASGIRRSVIEALIALLNAGIIPAFPPRAPSAPRAIWRRSPI